MIFIGSLVAVREPEAVVLERQASVVQPRGAAVAETAIPAGLPRELRSSLSVWRHQGQRSASGAATKALPSAMVLSLRRILLA